MKIIAKSDRKKAPAMPDKLDRARHIRAPKHAPALDEQTAGMGKHAGEDRTVAAHAATAEPDNADAGGEGRSPQGADIGASAALISICTIVSRITGFIRTWAMAFALGASLLSSSYQVANNLPNMLYELVVGGMLVTAFLPVYVSVKKKLGREGGNEYASNLLTIVVVLLGILSIVCMAFPGVAIYTQSFFSDQGNMDQATFFFQFFAIQIVFYGASAVVSGLLNANHDYLWSAIAPVANNVIVIATFIIYALVSPTQPELALYIIAIGNPLGVFVQMAMQIPALARNGIRLRPRINLHDPALRETLALGIPAVIVMLSSTAVVSVQSAASYVFADSGPSIIYYARLWFTLPYSFLVVPITTTMFTELADMHADGNIEGVKRGIISGTNQIIFFMVPFALYLIVFSTPLITMYHAGAFTQENITVVASYLAVFAAALPFYGVNTYLQKIFSTIRAMGVFAGINAIAAVVQIALTVAAAVATSSGMRGIPIESIAVAELVFYLVDNVFMFAYLRKRYGSFGLGSTARAFARALALGVLGAAAGAGVLFGLETLVAPLSGSMLQAFCYIMVGGAASLAVTFGLALALKVPEAGIIGSIASRVGGKLRR